MSEARGVIAAFEEQFCCLAADHVGTVSLYQNCHGLQTSSSCNVGIFRIYTPVRRRSAADSCVDFVAANSFTEIQTYVRSYSLDARCVLFDELFQPVVLGGQTLPNRLVLPPLTRSRAGEDGVPTPIMVDYYSQRAGAGLLISEGTVVSAQGASYARVPGLYTEEQVEGWRPVVAAARSRGASFYAQLWHVGRQAHSSVQPDGARPWAPSPVAITGWKYRSPHGRISFEVPRELSVEGIAEIVAQFAVAARNALEAGFDGVELHAANGYLFDQFLNSSSNKRTDHYGGSVQNRLRFLHEVLDAVTAEIPANRVGIRLSPSSSWMDVFDENKRSLYSELVTSISPRGLAYLHLVEPGIAGSIDAGPDGETIESGELGALFDGPVIVTGGHTPPTAAEAIYGGKADLVGFGRLFIANPDLPNRIKTGAELADVRQEGLYSGGPAGYTDYPEL
ncbi:alkene reductase [Paenarthrobacter nicotinovorans]|uniref:alkene reductase n=1 Tax=Paenarthrobacter nicotinovorans TaxID=29320 RepID=UPI003825ACBE